MLRQLALLLLSIVAVGGFVRPFVFLRKRPARTSVRMTLTKTSLFFDFDRIPYAAGVQHIHSPEHITETHRLGAPFFRLEKVGAPEFSDTKTSILFTCSTLFTKNMRVRMFAKSPSESNLLFFKDGRALYGVRFYVIPTKVNRLVVFTQSCPDPLFQAFTAHRLQLDVTFFTGNSALRATLKTLLPIFMFINGMEDSVGYQMPVHENSNFTEYRRGVLRGRGSDEFWIMAERVMREYSE